MKKILDRLTALVMVMLMVIQTITPAITSFAKEEELDKRYVIQKLETLKQDTYANFSLNLATVIDDKNLDTDTNVKFVLNATNTNSNIKLLVRKDFSLYDERTFDTVEEAHKEFDRVDKSLKDQGLSLDVSVVQEDGKYRIHNNYVPQAGKEDFGEDYKVYSLKVVPEFDFDKEGLYNKLPENDKTTEQHRLQLAEERRLQQDGEVPQGDKHNRTYIFDFKVDKAVDTKLTTIALNKDENNPVEVKQTADLFAAILDDRTYSVYQTEQLPAEVTSSIEHKKEVAKKKAEVDAKAKAEADAKAKKEADEKAKKEAEEKAKKDAKAKEEADAKAKAEADKQKAEEAKKTEEQKALDEKAKQEADAKAKAEAEKLKAEAEAKQKAEAEEKAKQEQLAKEQAEAEAKKLAEEKAKKDLENKKLLGLEKDTEENQEEETIIKKKETKEEVKSEPATPEERKQKAEEFDKALQDKKEDIKKSEDKKDANNKEDNNKTTDKKEVSKETKGLLEGIKEFFGLTNLQKADRELKAILSVKANGLKEVQALLSSFEDKYHLTKQEQAKLMDDNKDAIKALIEKDADKNFNPQMFAAMESSELTQAEKENLSKKKFTITTRFDASVANGNIPTTQTFTIKLDDKLTVKKGTVLPNIMNNGEVIATPSYNKDTNSITYNLVKEITKDLKIPLEIPVDYNVDNIKVDSNGNFTVTNKVSGIGVQAPQDLVPQKIDRKGNPVGSIIEPGRNDVIQVIDDKNGDYKVNTDSNGTPVVENGEMKGINWSIRISSNQDLKALGLKLNLTTVKGSGLGEIQKAKLNGTELKGPDFTAQLQGKLGIVDSKHHDLNSPSQELLYTFYTPVENKQDSYMLDISVLLKEKKKAGAVRLVQKEGYSQEKIDVSTPTRVGINNRTTIQGEFTSNSTAKWTITDGISSGDEENSGMPLADRKLEGDQTITSGKSAVYGLDADGKMVVKTVNQQNTDGSKNISKIPTKETDPQGKQAVGNIAVYELDTNLTEKENDSNKYSLSGVSISRYRDLPIDQHWNLPQGYEKMPAQDINVVDKSGQTTLGSVHVDAQENVKQRSFTVPNVKYWNIDGGKATPIDHKIKQTFPTDNVKIGTKEYKYNENTSYYNYNDKNHFILNSLMEIDNKKPATFKIVKVDSETGEKLQGASFHLLGSGVSVVTDANGEATFTNIPPGTYSFQETKAPNGYKLDGEEKKINISDDGNVSVSGKNVDFSQPAGKTEVVEHNKYPSWPDYMNAMHYGKVDADGNAEFYLYLKPIAPRQGGQTDRNTRLDISIPGVNITDVTAYGVGPGNRANVKSAMEAQTAGTLNLGNSVINANHKNKITSATNTTDSYTGRTGYQIYFPKERFADDWGFLVKVKANIGQNNSASLYYDWLTNEDTANQANIQKVVRLSKNTSGPDDKPTITIKNTPFEKKPIEIVKFADTFTDGKRDRLAGAEFVLKDSEGNTIKNVFTDKDGKASFGEHPEGKYTIYEVKAPDGYEKNGVYFEVEVNESSEVSYKARFENSSATPQPGQDYFIEKGKEIGAPSGNIVTSVNQWLDYNEGQSYSRGERPKVWEAYRYESLKYHADITLSSSSKNERFEIQFDPNLDFTQYFNGFPKLRINGKDVADPYFNYETNLLTYVFNDKTDGGPATATIDLIGMVPSKYYAKNTGTYPFTITVQPNQTNISGQKYDKNIEAFFDSYDSGHNEPIQNYYFREIYEENGQYYVDVISYYNVIGDRNPYKKVGQKTLNYNWITTKFQGGNIANWTGEGTEPRQVLDRVKIYRTEANVRVINNETLINDYMPLSMGYNAEQNPNIYRPVFNASVDSNQNATISQNGITLIYDRNQINPNGKLIDDKNQPLKIKMPSINNGEGYVIEQRFKIPDIDAFNNKWRAFVMNNGNLKSAFASGANKSFAKGDQTGGETPKYYKEDIGVINKKYTPGQFKIIKSNESDKSKLPGATFELTDANNKTIYRTSDNNGELSFTNLVPGSYTLKETKAPKDFIKSEKRWTVTVYSDGSVRITQVGLAGSDESYFGNNENIIIMPVSNKPSGAEFRVYKKDSDGKPLQGAKFVIKNKDGTKVIKSGESNDNGVVEFKDLTQGTYIIEESEAPSGYNKLGKKWVLVIGADGSKKVYNYREKTTGTSLNSILEQPGVNWVDVAGRSLDGWNLYDNRYTGWTGNNVDPFKLGTRIVGINRKDKYIIQRYVINPEAAKIGATSATIHREKPEYPNMDWYSGALNSGEEIQVFKLNKPVTGVISDIRLAEYGATEITGQVTKGVDKSRFGEPQRLKLDFPATDKPLVIDVKVPYKEESGGVGTGMDWTENGTTYWKSDYYERASVIKEASPVVSNDGNIVGSYVSDGSLDVTNEFKTFDFKLKKVKDNDNTKAIEGAKFKLTGPGEGGEEREITTGKDGIISFDKLRPGIYKLEEIEPAPGYEKSNVDWTVRITSDGNKYIKVNKKTGVTENTKLVDPAMVDPNTNSTRVIRSAGIGTLLKDRQNSVAYGYNSNLLDTPTLMSMNEFFRGETVALANNGGLEISEESIPTPLRAESDWQKVDPSASTGRRKNIQEKDLASTKITEINKYGKKFRQVFLLKDGDSNSKREVQFHREPEDYGISLNDGGKTTYKIYTVDQKSTLDNPINLKDVTKACTQTYPTPSGKKQRIKSEIPATIRGPLYVEIETPYNNQYGVGLGVDYIYSRGSGPWGDISSLWIADSYDKEASINKNLVSSYDLNITNGANGTVTAEKTTGIKKDEQVTLNVNPEDKYELEKLTVAGLDVTSKVADGKYSFTMPASNVAVSATFKAKLYSVWTQTVDHGSITASPNSNLKAGDKVTITVKPETGYKLEKITYNDNNGDEQTLALDQNNQFTMPAYSMALTAHFVDERPSYEVQVAQNITGGTITANATSAKEGDTVSLSASPSEGFLLGQFVVKDASGKEITLDENNQFTMPKSNVTVTAIFKEKPKNVYPISIEPSQNGSVGVAASATNGEEVTVSVNPNDYYELASLTYNGNPITKDGQGNYKFTMPDKPVSISASFKQKEITGPQEGEIAIPKEGEPLKITNKQTGLDLKIFKRDSNSRPLEGGKFTLKKTDENYTTEDTTFTKIKGISSSDGKLVFTDKNDKEQTLALQPGYYVLEETESPSGYKKAQAPWKIHVYEDTTTNQLKAEYQGPDETPNSFVSSDKALHGYDPKAQEQQSPIKTTNSGIKYAARMTNINTEGKTYIQRIYIDTRGYKGPVNVQIKPVVKREELDAPGQPPKIGYEGKYGVKTAYRSTYEIKGLADSPTDAKLNDIFRNYTIANDDVSVVNTARWRPFDWGFDEDQLNLDPGVYYIDVEGFYDDNITDVGKIEMDIDFKTPRYFWQADGFNQDNTQHFKLGGSYQAGAETFGSVYEKDTYVNGVLKKKGTPTPWGASQPTGQKYPNWLSKEFKDQYKRNWKFGIVAVPNGTDDETIDSVTTSINIKPLYTSTKKTQVGPEGMDIVNDEETYNITFSKHGRDNKDEDINGEDVTKRRLEGAVFKLQEYVINGYKDVEGSTISSAFNGYFGFRGLKPGRYQLIEVKAPEGYKPINGPLLQFTVETIKTNSGKIVDPESGNVVDIKSIIVKFAETDTKTYKLSDLSMVNPDDANQIIKVSSVDSKKISIKDSQIVNPTTNAIVNLNDLIIVTADGHGYPINQIKIVDGSSGYISLEYDKANGVYQYVPEKSTSEKDGKLVDFVTSATAKNMGKIINEKPGKGEITVKKVDQKGNAINATDQLPGAKFKLTNKSTGWKEEKTVGPDGTLKFTGLNIGDYRLEEVKSPDGYINNKQVWNFTVGGEGLDPYAGEAPQRRDDVSSSIKITESKLSVLNPNSKNEGLLSENQKEMHPHLGEVFEFANKYTIDSNLKINPGDYFVLKLSKNIDLHGIMETNISNLDIIADGVGTIAKADYDRKEGTITYTFTDYAKTYNLTEFSNKLKAYINLNKVPKAGSQSIERGVVGHDMIKNNIEVVYDSMTAREKYQANDGNWYEMKQNYLNLGSKIIKFNPDTGEFVHYYYVNRDRSNTPRSRFYYSSDQDIENMNIEYYRLDGNAKLDELMPLSFGVNEDDSRLPEPVRIRSRSKLYSGEEESFTFPGGLDSNSTYLVKVTGKVTGNEKNKDGYVGHGMLQMIDYPGRYVTRWDNQYFFKNEAAAKADLNIQAVNPENIIKFKKVDQDGNPLADAKFQLQYKNKEGQWVADTSRDKTTGADGVFEYTKLKPGSYKVIEISAPEGYKKAEDPVAVFDVDENGRIIRKDNKTPVGGTAGNTSTNEEEHGAIPIEIVNKKEHKITFVKVDAKDNKTKLAGAKFEVWYKAKKEDTEYTKLKLYEKTADGKTERLAVKEGENIPAGFTPVKEDKFTTGEDGLVEFNFYDSGYYGIKEVKAPRGYIAPKDFVKEFIYKDGKLYEARQSYMSMSLSRASLMNRITFGWYHVDTYTLTVNPDNMMIDYPKADGENSKSILTLSGFKSNGTVKVYRKAKGQEVQKTGYVPTFNFTNNQDLAIDLNKAIASIKAGSDTTGTTDIKSDDSIVLEIKEDTSWNTEVKRNVKLDIKDKNASQLISENKDITVEASFASGGDNIYSGTKKFDSLPEIKPEKQSDGTYKITPIEIENKKGEYPLTGAMGIIGFLVAGAVIMTTAYYKYRRKRRESALS
ncbi:LPXTG-motif cell wall anchor domain protein [Finegoldia magna ACS-171-V-Col3]|uniref:SpaA isopeptide-forming pilin-related protein n=1 Tax=Finegoldia magna TaxID=1260 RepID=UPI0001DE5A1C|nr:SpaA isopeptide-forming pilin-related protein [Finegoldia magna]EFK94291.1 LPXTG-motif cell wall anchor domain protein [Finegoldia magna ACS-171-V-Col3]